MKKMRVLTSRANFISWVTMSMVMPSLASCRMTLSTSPTMVGSRAEVGSSKRMTSGCIARHRAMATRCFCPPESSDGIAWAFSARPTLLSNVIASSRASCFVMSRNNNGTMVRFSRMERCSKRLKFWNTMPTFWRNLLSG